MRSILPLLVVVLAPAASLAAAQPACELPSVIQPPEVRRPDYRNPGLEVDYLAWVLSWSPEHCSRQSRRDTRGRHHFQCSLNRFDFVVHGLWPQDREARSSRDHPRHCAGSAPLAESVVRRHLCTVPGAELMQQQWQAHGTCHWPSPDEYFGTIEQLSARYRRPRYRELAREVRTRDAATVKAGDIKQAFVDLNAGLTKRHLRITVDSGNWLKEVWICLTPDRHRPMPLACPEGGTPDDQPIRIRPPRGS